MNSLTAAPMSPAFPAAIPAARTTSGEKLEKHFSPLVQQFLTYLKLEKHFSEYTVKSYGADLIQFGQFMSGEIGQQQHATQPGANPATGNVSGKVSVEELDKRQLACE